MLFVFTISITPKIYFHDAFSHHDDELVATTGAHEKQITTYHYNCGFVNVVAITPFITGPAAVDAVKIKAYPLLNDVVEASYEHHALFNLTLRGPPAA